MICLKCRHEIYKYPCHCGYSPQTGKITRKTSVAGYRTLKEIGLMWKAETPEYRKSHKWNAYCKRNRKK